MKAPAHGDWGEGEVGVSECQSRKHVFFQGQTTAKDHTIQYPSRVRICRSSHLGGRLLAAWLDPPALYLNDLKHKRKKKEMNGKLLFPKISRLDSDC